MRVCMCVLASTLAWPNKHLAKQGARQNPILYMHTETAHEPTATGTHLLTSMLALEGVGQ
jgi:hypothetical protein